MTYFSISGYSDIVYALENNFSMRNIPFPVFDVAPCLKNHPERTDILMRRMQEYLQRNSNGFKRVNGQGFRLQHGFLLSSTHQLVDKLVSETQETMSMRQGGLSMDSGVQRLIEDAENSKQLLPKLQEAVRCEQHPIEMKLTRIANDLSHSIRSYLEETMETMLRTGVDQCPKTLGNQSVINDLRKNCHERLNIPDEFLHACIMNNAGGEIMNKIRYDSQSNRMRMRGNGFNSLNVCLCVQDLRPMRYESPYSLLSRTKTKIFSFISELLSILNFIQIRL